jgi:DNA-directed RNA polymerase specialized sigma24 family protein
MQNKHPRCPHCGKVLPQPSPGQIKAYTLTEVHGHTQEAAAQILGITRHAVWRRLERLYAIRPDLRPEKKRRGRRVKLDHNLLYGEFARR